MRTFSRNVAVMVGALGLLVIVLGGGILTGMKDDAKKREGNVPQGTSTNLRSAPEVVPSYPDRTFGGIPKQRSAELELITRMHRKELFESYVDARFGKYGEHEWDALFEEDKAETARMMQASDSELSLLLPWLIMDLTKDRTTLGDGHTVGDVMKDLLADKANFERLRAEVGSSLRSVGARDAATAVERAATPEELTRQAADYRTMLETQADRIYEKANVSARWLEYMQVRGELGALKMVRNSYDDLIDAQAGKSGN